VLEVRRREKVLQRRRDALARIHLAIGEPLLEILGRQIDVHNLVGLGQHGIRKPLADFHADELLNRVVQALQC